MNPDDSDYESDTTELFENTPAFDKDTSIENILQSLKVPMKLLKQRLVEESNSSSLREEVDMLRAKFEEINKELESNRKESSEKLKSQDEEIQDLKSKLETSLDMNEELEENLQAVSKKLKSQDDEIQCLISELETSSNMNKELEENLQAVSKKLKSQDEEIQCLISELETSSNMNKELELNLKASLEKEKTQKDEIQELASKLNYSLNMVNHREVAFNDLGLYKANSSPVISPMISNENLNQKDSPLQSSIRSFGSSHSSPYMSPSQSSNRSFGSGHSSPYMSPSQSSYVLNDHYSPNQYSSSQPDSYENFINDKNWAIHKTGNYVWNRHIPLNGQHISVTIMSKFGTYKAVTSNLKVNGKHFVNLDVKWHNNLPDLEHAKQTVYKYHFG